VKDSTVPDHLAVRLAPEIMARIDALLSFYSEPWHAATRSDAVRAVILAGLPLEERRADATAKPRAKSKASKKKK
jgi:hypothetical protein